MTDSLFLKTPLLTGIIRKTLEELRPDEDFHNISTYLFRFLGYFGSTYSGHLLKIMDDRHWHTGKGRYKYKSEYFYEKILLLKAKKTYVGLMSVQEGFKIPIQYDEKNLEKTSYSKASRAFIKELTQEILNLDKDTLDFSAIFEIVIKHKNSIIQSILDLDVSSGSPKKFKNKNEYDAPFGQANFVAGEIFNIFYKEEAYISGEGYATFDLITPKIKAGKNVSEADIVTQILNFYQDYLQKDKFLILYNILVNNTYPEMRDYFIKNLGIPYIGFKRNEPIKEEFLDLIDIESVVMKNIDSRGVNFLEAIGIFVDEKTGSAEITNIINF